MPLRRVRHVPRAPAGRGRTVGGLVVVSIALLSIGWGLWALATPSGGATTPEAGGNPAASGPGAGLGGGAPSAYGAFREPIRMPDAATPGEIRSWLTATGALDAGGDMPPNILLVTVCSARADRIGAYGGPAPTPTLDALADQGIRFDNAWATATFTLPSHASILTGLLPGRTGVVASQDRLSTDLTTLPEVLKLYGYTTVAWAPVASRASFRSGDGLEQGFDRFVEAGSDRAGEGLDGVLASVPEPWFALAHFKDAHRPYGFDRTSADPRIATWIEGTLARDLPEDPSAVFARELAADPALRTSLLAQYDTALERVDAHVAASVAAVHKLGVLERTVVVVVGDHGEALGENGHVGHQGHLDPEVVRVPLLVRLPRSQGAGRVVTDDVSLVDLLPTLLELGDAEAPAGIDGRSLAPLLRGESLPARPAIAESEPAPDASDRVPEAVVVGGGAWLEHRKSADHLKVRGSDGTWAPAEDPALLAKLRAEYDARLGAPAARVTRPLSPEEKKKLQAEGYW